MTEHQFDDFFRKKLQHHASAVPEDMWEKIMRRKGRRRRLIIWWSFAALLTGMLAGSYFLFTPHQQHSANTVAKKAATDSGNQLTGLQQKNAHDSTITYDSMHQHISEAGKASTPEDRIASAEEKPSTAKIEPQKNKGRSTGNNRPGKSIKGDKRPGKSAAVELNATVKANAKEQHREETGELALQQNNTNTAPGTTNDSGKDTVTNIPTDVASGKDSSITALLDSSKTKPLADTANQPSQVTKAVKKHKEPLPRENYFEVFVSPDYTIKQSAAMAGHEDYLARKNGAESRVISFTAGLRYMHLLNNHFFIKTGLQYTQVNERFNYKSLPEYRTVPVAVARSIYTGVGTTYLTSSSMMRQVGYRLIEEYNRYSSLDVPLLLGYQTNGSSAFKASVSAGVIFNLQSSYKGYVVDSLFKAVNINDAGIYKNKLGMSLYFSIGLSRTLSEKWSLFGEPYFRLRLNNMTQTAQPFMQKFHAAGLSLGLRYNF